MRVPRLHRISLALKGAIVQRIGSGTYPGFWLGHLMERRERGLARKPPYIPVSPLRAPQPSKLIIKHMSPSPAAVAALRALSPNLPRGERFLRGSQY